LMIVYIPHMNVSKSVIEPTDTCNHSSHRHLMLRVMTSDAMFVTLTLRRTTVLGPCVTHALL